MTTITLSVLFSLSTALVVGSFTLFVRSGQRHANAVSGVLIGLIVSMPPLLVGAVWMWEPAHYQPLGWLFFALAGIAGPAVGRVCFFHSIHLMGVARAVPLNSTMPLFSAIAGIYVLGEKPGLYILAGTVLIVLGCMGITARRGESQPIRGEYLLIALGSAVFFSISHMLRKLGVGVSPNPFLGISIMSIAGGVFLYISGQYLPRGLRPSLMVKKSVGDLQHRRLAEHPFCSPASLRPSLRRPHHRDPPRRHRTLVGAAAHGHFLAQTRAHHLADPSGHGSGSRGRRARGRPCAVTKQGPLLSVILVTVPAYSGASPRQLLSVHMGVSQKFISLGLASFFLLVLAASGNHRVHHLEQEVQTLLGHSANAHHAHENHEGHHHGDHPDDTGQEHSTCVLATAGTMGARQYGG